MDSTRDKAVQIIDSGADLRRWRDATTTEINQRKKHLAKLRERLLGPQPKPRKLKRIEKSSTDFQAGDVAVFHLDNRTSVRFCVLSIWGDRGGSYADICLLGLDDDKPLKIRALSLSDTLGPHYTMLEHEPADTVTLLCRGVRLPECTRETLAAWHAIPIQGHVCLWRDFPEVLRTVLPRLGWS